MTGDDSGLDAVREQVARIEADVAALVACGPAAPTVERVGTLGTVTVAADGALLAVDLDGRELAWASPDGVAAALCAAVARAAGSVRDA